MQEYSTTPVAKFNTLFGTVEIKAPTNAGQFALPSSVTLDGGASQSYVFRELGLSKKLTRNELLIAAIDDGAKWLRLRQISLYNLGVAADAAFKKAYTDAITYGEKDDVALAHANKAARDAFNSGKVIHDLNFPKDIYQKLTIKIKN
jgi:hypothetical protein